MFLFFVNSCFAVGPLSRWTQKLHPAGLAIPTVQTRYSSGGCSRKFEVPVDPAVCLQSSSPSSLSELLELNTHSMAIFERLFAENKQLRNQLEIRTGAMQRSLNSDNVSLFTTQKAKVLDSDESIMSQTALDKYADEFKSEQEKNTSSDVSSDLIAEKTISSRQKDLPAVKQVAGKFIESKNVYGVTNDKKKTLTQVENCKQDSDVRPNISGIIDRILKVSNPRYPITRQDVQLILAVYTNFPLYPIDRITGVLSGKIISGKNSSVYSDVISYIRRKNSFLSTYRGIYIKLGKSLGGDAMSIMRKIMLNRDKMESFSTKNKTPPAATNIESPESSV